MVPPQINSPLCFLWLLTCAGIAIFKPLVIEQRLKTIREQLIPQLPGLVTTLIKSRNGIGGHATDEISPSDDQKKSPVHLENRQTKETGTTGAPDLASKMRHEGEVKPVKAPAGWYQFWK